MGSASLGSAVGAGQWHNVSISSLGWMPTAKQQFRRESSEMEAAGILPVSEQQIIIQPIVSMILSYPGDIVAFKHSNHKT